MNFGLIWRYDEFEGTDVLPSDKGPIHDTTGERKALHHMLRQMERAYLLQSCKNGQTEEIEFTVHVSCVVVHQ